MVVIVCPVCGFLVEVNAVCANCGQLVMASQSEEWVNTDKVPEADLPEGEGEVNIDAEEESLEDDLE